MWYVRMAAINLFFSAKFVQFRMQLIPDQNEVTCDVVIWSQRETAASMMTRIKC